MKCFAVYPIVDHHDLFVRGDDRPKPAYRLKHALTRRQPETTPFMAPFPAPPCGWAEGIGEVRP